MTKQQRREEAEAFVRRVTSQVFKQKLDPATLREVARKVAESVEVEPTTRAASERQPEPA